MPLSVVIPTRDRSASLAKTLAALRCAGADEVIVVDNGSSDDTAAVASAGGASQVLTVAQPSAAAARNAGIRSASGDVVVCLDDDIRVGPTTLRHLADEVLACGGFVVAQLEPPPEVEISPFYRWRLAQDRFSPTSDLEPIDWFQSGLVGGPRAAFADLLYSQEFAGAGLEDVDFAVRALAAGHGIYFARNVRAVHDDYAGADLRAAWRRTRSNAASAVTFARLHPHHPRSAAITARPHWAKAAVLRAAASAPGRATLFAAAAGMERVPIAHALLGPVYRLSLAGATHVGAEDARSSAA